MIHFKRRPPIKNLEKKSLTSNPETTEHSSDQAQGFLRKPNPVESKHSQHGSCQRPLPGARLTTGSKASSPSNHHELPHGVYEVMLCDTRGETMCGEASEKI